MGGSESKDDPIFACCGNETEYNQQGQKQVVEYGIPDSFFVQDFSVYQFNRTVNESLDAVVQEYYQTTTDEIVIVKSINYNNKQEFEYAYRQAFNLYLCQNKNIIPFKGYFDKKRVSPKGDIQGTFCILMESVTSSFQSELTNRILQGVPFDHRELYHLFSSVISGLEFIHSRNIFHLNIKTTNVLLKKNNTPGSIKWDILPEIKISDIVHEKLNSEITRAEAIYVPPEVRKYLLEKEDAPKSWDKTDVYSLGILLLQALVLQDLKSENIDSEYIQKLIELHEDKYPEYSQILYKMLSEEPADRPTFAELSNQIRLIDSNI